MPDDYRISDLTTVSAISDADLMELSAVNPASDTGYSSMKMPITALASKLLGGTQYAADLQTAAKTIFGAINEVAGIVLSGTLTAGQTSITFTNAAITASSTLANVWINVFGVYPTNIVITDGSITLTFESQASDLRVKVRII